jgi:hypothetical protein
VPIEGHNGFSLFGWHYELHADRQLSLGQNTQRLVPNPYHREALTQTASKRVQSRLLEMHEFSSSVSRPSWACCARPLHPHIDRQTTAWEVPTMQLEEQKHSRLNESGQSAQPVRIWRLVCGFRKLQSLHIYSCPLTGSQDALHGLPVTGEGQM